MQSVASTTNHATREFSPPANSDNGSSLWDNGSAQLIELDRLLADSLLRFVNQPAEAMERELAVVTRLLLDAGGFDRCGLMKFAPDKNSATAVHVSHREGGIALPEVLTSRESFPWATERLVSGNIISFADPADLPPRAKPDRQQFAALVAMSYLAIPIYMGSSVEYFIFAQQACPGRSWHKSLISVLRLTGETFVKTLARSVEGRQVSQQLRFEQLITELSVRFINVTPDRVDQEIMAALQQLLEFFQFDRCGLLTYSPDKKQVLVTHACYGNGIVPVPEKVDISYLYPWANEKLLSGQFIHFSSLAELPPEAVVDRHTWQAIGVKSNINIPIQIGGSVEYLIAGQDTRSHRRGQDELLLRLRLVGEIFANALIRCRAEEARIKACEEILALREKLQLEAEQLQSEIKLTKVHDGMIGKSVALA
ncbi:MAG TPA: Fis family transcriptional regulator, partial [Geobacteraceae bacterium]